MIPNFYIREYTKSVPKELCRAAVELHDKDIENHEEPFYVYDDGSKKQADAVAVRISLLDHWKEIDSAFFDIVGQAYARYREDVPILKTIHEPISDYAYEIHKYVKGIGNQGVHYDSGTTAYSQRICTILIYLNDVQEGGRTVFTELGQNIIPEEGKILVFPSALTHVHMAEKPVSNDKYVFRTWMQFT